MRSQLFGNLSYFSETPNCQIIAQRIKLTWNTDFLYAFDVLISCDLFGGLSVSETHVKLNTVKRAELVAVVVSICNIDS